MGGGQKFVFRRLRAVGRYIVVTANPGQMVTQPTAEFEGGGSNPIQTTVVGGTAAMFARQGPEPPTKKSEEGCITIRPLLALRTAFLSNAWNGVRH